MTHQSAQGREGNSMSNLIPPNPPLIPPAGESDRAKEVEAILEHFYLMRGITDLPDDFWQKHKDVGVESVLKSALCGLIRRAELEARLDAHIYDLHHVAHMNREDAHLAISNSIADLQQQLNETEK